MDRQPGGAIVAAPANSEFNTQGPTRVLPSGRGWQQDSED
jgi:hypothetical protein